MSFFFYWVGSCRGPNRKNGERKRERKREREREYNSMSTRRAS
jgi:hypothetical protein